MSKRLVIVESPAKARTIGEYLGSGYEVLASFGHVRDLPPKDGSVLPEQDFLMRWERSSSGLKPMKAISEAAKRCDGLLLATDPDREGEAIAWHVKEELSSKRLLKGKSVERVAFNAITRRAVREAVGNPRQVDMELVEAYLARRALDYLVGFTLSPVLWRKLPGSRSAGRVQSVALRLIVSREMEVERFVSREYWSILARMRGEGGSEFQGRLHSLDGKVLGKFALGDEGSAALALERVKAGSYRVLEVETKPMKRNPPPPFTTSTLQQEASRKLGMDAGTTMGLAQKLYEAGRITYMRTDGVQMAEEAYAEAREVIGSRFGSNYLPEKARRYSSKAKNAQEAHEAVRPTRFEDVPDMGGKGDLYGLIWKRAVASQMGSALLERTRVDMSDAGVVLRATGQVVRFDGFLKLYEEGRDEAEEELSRLPSLQKGECLDLAGAEKRCHQTEPPPRYTESSLVKRMEELGIGRPSTYASTLSTLRERGYVRMDRKRFVPEDSGRLVTVFLERFFAPVVEYDFTAGLEEKLDLVSDGKLGWKVLLQDFWREFEDQAGKASELTRTEVIEALDQVLESYLFAGEEEGKDLRSCPKCEQGRLGLKLGRHGAFIGCSGYPECRYVRPFAGGSGEDLSPDLSPEDSLLGLHPQTGEKVWSKSGRFGPYVEMSGSGEKPQRASIPKGWEEVTLERAVGLLSLPREIGNHEGEQVKAGIGRYGPYVVSGKTYVNLGSVEEVFEIGLNRAVSLLSDKRSNPRGRRVEPLRDLGEHSGERVQVFSGRYGPYVKLGKVNATIPDGEDLHALGLDRALQLIEEKAAKGSRGPRGPRESKGSRGSRGGSGSRRGGGS